MEELRQNLDHLFEKEYTGNAAENSFYDSFRMDQTSYPIFQEFLSNLADIMTLKKINTTFDTT